MVKALSRFFCDQSIASLGYTKNNHLFDGKVAFVKYQKVFIKQDNLVEVQCPRCRSKKSFPAEKLGSHKRYAKLRCVCGDVFLAQFEFRHKFRKQTNLQGYYLNVTLDDRNRAEALSETSVFLGQGIIREVNCLITNLSKDGLRFIASGPGTHQIKPGHQLLLFFHLDNSANTEIKKRVVVRSVNKDYIGCQFLGKDKYDSVLGFYLL